MVPVFSIGSSEIDVPAAVEQVQFRGPDLPRKGSLIRSLPDEMPFSDSGQVVRGMNRDCTISFGEAPKVALFLGIADDPGVLSDANRVNEVGARKSSGFAVGGVRAVLGHTGIPIPYPFIEVLYDSGVFSGEIAGLTRIPWEVEKLRIRPIKIDEVFPRSLPDGQVWIVFFESMAEPRAIGRASPEEGSLP